MMSLLTLLLTSISILASNGDGGSGILLDQMMVSEKQLLKLMQEQQFAEISFTENPNGLEINKQVLMAGSGDGGSSTSFQLQLMIDGLERYNSSHPAELVSNVSFSLINESEEPVKIIKLPIIENSGNVLFKISSEKNSSIFSAPIELINSELPDVADALEESELLGSSWVEL